MKPKKTMCQPFLDNEGKLAAKYGLTGMPVTHLPYGTGQIVAKDLHGDVLGENVGSYIDKKVISILSLEFRSTR